MIDAAPLAGPVRLRHVPADPRRLNRLAEAFTDAIVLSGLAEYGTETVGGPGQHRAPARGRPEGASPALQA